MKTLEFNHGGKWIDHVLNAWPFCLHKESIKPVLRLTLGYKERAAEGEQDKWKWGDVLVGRSAEDKSLYRNGVFFLRFMRPFFIGISIRWAGKDPGAREYAQAGLGWKLNGRFTVTVRVKSDIDSAEGEHGPNFDQAQGWAGGNK